MRNLAGVQEADEFIQEELSLAGIERVQGEMRKSEVPSSITGRLGGWEFVRAWYYWIAVADGDGLSLEAAIRLHETPYPISGPRQPATYGLVVRVAGHCGAPHPQEWASPPHIIRDLEKQRAKHYDFVGLYDASAQEPRFIGLYHIDTQIGLNEFARVLRDRVH